MRKLSMRVYEFTAPSGQEFMPLSYPHDGLFLHADGRIFSRFGGCMISIIGVPATAYSEEAGAAATTGPSSVSENLLLKAIAISQRPELAATLVGGA